MDNARARNLEALPTTSSVTLPIMNTLYKILGLAALAVTCVAAETHVVSFDNRSVLRLWRLCTQGHEANFKPYCQGADVVLHMIMVLWYLVCLINPVW